MIVSTGHFQFPRKPTPWPSDACEQRERNRLGSPSVASFIPWHERDGREVAVGIRGQEGERGGGSAVAPRAVLALQVDFRT